jgi:predicted nucleic acid-binding protein
VTDRFCIDTSAWHRIGLPAVAQSVAHRLDLDQVSICDQVRLEILYSTQSAVEYDALSIELSALHVLISDENTFERALEIQHSLAHVGGLHHRSVKIADLLIAASAEAAGDIVWHYDADFDRIAQVSGQRCEWIALRGSL